MVAARPRAEPRRGGGGGRGGAPSPPPPLRVPGRHPPDHTAAATVLLPDAWRARQGPSASSAMGEGLLGRGVVRGAQSVHRRRQRTAPRTVPVTTPVGPGVTVIAAAGPSQWTEAGGRGLCRRPLCRPAGRRQTAGKASRNTHPQAVVGRVVAADHPHVAAGVPTSWRRGRQCWWVDHCPSASDERPWRRPLGGPSGWRPSARAALSARTLAAAWLGHAVTRRGRRFGGSGSAALSDVGGGHAFNSTAMVARYAAPVAPATVLAH